MEIHIELKPISWNVLARKNHWKYPEIFNDWKTMVSYAIYATKKTKFKNPVNIAIHAKWKEKRRHDIDSLMIKPVIDQLVTEGILMDDSLEYVQSVTFTGEIGAKVDELIVTISEGKELR